MARSRRKKISTLGTLAILAGSLAWFAMRTGRLDKGAVLIGAGGTVLALLAVLGSVVIENTGKIVPLLGLLASASVAGFGMSHEPTRGQVADQLKQWLVRFTPAPPPAPKPAAAAPVVVAPPQEDVKPFGTGTIFDMTQGGKGTAQPPNNSGAAPAPVVIPAAVVQQGEPRAQAPSALGVNPPQSIPEPPVLNATQRYTAAAGVVDRARAKVEAATAGLLPALSQTSAYQAAKSELDAADAALKSARATAGPGNAELVTVGQRYINAKTAVQKLINDVAETDPATVAARQELITAQGDLRAAKEDLSNTKGTGKK